MKVGITYDRNEFDEEYPYGVLNMSVYNKDDHYLNFSPRMQRNLIESGFEFIGEPQIHVKTQRTFYVYEKTYDLQLFLGMFRANKEKLGSLYKECQLIKMFRESKLPKEITIEDCGIIANKFTKL